MPETAKTIIVGKIVGKAEALAGRFADAVAAVADAVREVMVGPTAALRPIPVRVRHGRIAGRR